MITHFHDKTPNEVRAVLSRLCHSGKRVRIWTGDTETGEAWTHVANTSGYIGNSTGSKKIALLVHNSRSLGGPALLDDCILRIDQIDTRRTLYQHPRFHLPSLKMEFEPMDKERPWKVFAGGECIRACRTPQEARAEIEYQQGKRYNLNQTQE